MRQKYFGVPFANAGDKTTVPDAAQVDGSVSYSQGYGPDYQLDLTTNPAALPMPRQQDNQLKYDLTYALQALQQGNAPEWIAAADNGGVAYSYVNGARVYYSDSIGVDPFYTYVSLVDANNVAPLTDATKWRREGPFREIPGLGAALTSGGSANVQTLTPFTPLDAYQPYAVYEFIAGFTNTGATTLNVSGLGAKSIFIPGPTGPVACTGGEIGVGDLVRVRYDGTRFQLIAGGAATGTGSKVRSVSPTITGTAVVSGLTLSGGAMGDAVVTPYTMNGASHQALITGANSANYSMIFDNTFASGGNQKISQFLLRNQAPNNSTATFIECVDTVGTKMQFNSNGGISNFSANNVNLSDARVKPEFEQYTDGELDALAQAWVAVDWGRFKYEDQTHDDWNYGYTAQGIERAFASVAPTLTDVWNPLTAVPTLNDEGETVLTHVPTPAENQLKAVYSTDLDNIGHALLAKVLRDMAEMRAEILDLRSQLARR